MSGHREKVVALFERHRATPGAPYEADHFLDFLLAKPRRKRAVYNSFRGLRRFNAFIDEVQLEFGICFSLKDREANYSLDRFVERVVTLERSRRSSLASLGNQMKAGPGRTAMFVAGFALLVVAIWLHRHSWAVGALVAVGSVIGIWFARFSRQVRTYQATLLARIGRVDEEGGGP
jgi:hypothetical protein